jgi:CelD/BcsL family acetyltransferase involved in cellulose biosynthesis
MLAIVEVPLRATVFDRKEIREIVPSWDSLAKHAVEDNVYYTAGHVLPALDHIDRSLDVRFLTLWDRSTLAGLLPFVRRPSVPGLRAGAVAWQSSYTFSGTPLIAQDYLHRAALTMVEAMARCHHGEWMIGKIKTHGPVASALASVLAEKHAPVRFLNSFQRASLEPKMGFEDHMTSVLSKSQRKNLAKRKRNLEKNVTLDYKSATHGQELKDAVSAFLRLEASGWKGKRGTALSVQCNTQKFAEEILSDTDGRSVRADMLLANGEPIAMVMTAFSGETGFTLKSAFDENYKSYSAGLLLEVELLKHFLDKPWAKRLDSSTYGAHVIDDFWPGRDDISDMVMSLAPTASELRINSLCIANAAKMTLKQNIKTLIGRK